MSFTYSYLAARCELPKLQAALLAAWPTLELAEPAQEFASWGEAFRWAGPRSGYLTGAHPHDVKLLHRDGAWSVISDISTCMSADTESLVALSRRVGRVVVATTQGTAGFAQLLVFEDGAAIRSITGEAGHLAEFGAALPEEAGISLASFYLDELDAIWQRLGLASFLAAEPAAPAVALHVIDRTPYAEMAAAPAAQRAAETSPRPWWKFW